ncbi:prostaglandin D2 receptor 2-like [Osmerus mordax]|uniref:prostaglandin D2 receptor 2-like n=1 Tax=Osmerus mordax TaxID=8014 RepID=UPI00350FC717
MSTSSSPGPYCKLLDSMLNHTLSITPGVNLGVVCIHGLVSCLGILENALVLWILGVRLRRTTVSSVWVLNLAASDFLATLTLPLFTHYLSQSHSWELGRPLCSAYAFVFYLNMFVSAFLLAAISLDRCLLVARPVWSQNHRSVGGAWKVCGVGWLWAAANALPYFLFRAVTETHDKSRSLCYHNFALYASPAVETDCMVRQAATAVSKTLLAFLLPLVVIAGSYGLLCVSLRKRRMRRKENAERLASTWILNEGGGGRGASIAKISSIFKPSSRKPNSTTTPASPVKRGGEAGLSRGFTKMVTAVIAAFVLCWAPYHAFCLMEVAAQYWSPGVKLVEVGLPLATTFAFLNPILNPVLYAFSCPQFCVRVRQGLSALVEGLVEEEGGGGGRRLSLKPLEKKKGGERLAQPSPPPPIPLLSPSSPSLPSPSSHSSHYPSLYVRAEGGQEETEERSGAH